MTVKRNLEKTVTPAVGGFEGTADELVAFAALLQRRHEAKTSIQRRKAQGQYFTPPSIARFMARLFSPPGRHLRILDAGAGVGILSAAICDRVPSLRAPRSLQLVLFETDAGVLPLLDENMRRCRSALRQAGHELRYAIEHSDFVLASRPARGQGTLFENHREHGEFDAAIMNPPYFKLNKQCAHARAFECIIRGQPNIYALFMAAAALMLRPGGAFVAITPRSFCVLRETTCCCGVSVPKRSIAGSRRAVSSRAADAGHRRLRSRTT